MATVAVLQTDSKRSVYIDNLDYKRTIKVNTVLPFRIKITNIKVPGYSPTAPSPIGLAIIGFNNYILWYNHQYGRNPNQHT